jgi:hypothetical protein
MITLYVGDVTDEVRIAAHTYDPTTTLLTSQNYTNLTAGTYYVSLGDFENLQQFVDALAQASVLVYVPVESWSDTKNQHSYMKHWTEFYLMFFKDKKTVSIDTDAKISNELDSWLDLTAHRQTESAQLWITGCSTTHGVGVDEHERYGQLIADKLNLPVSFLTKSGSSIIWSADQLLRSDLRGGDIVVWGLTNVGRFPYYDNDKLNHVNFKTYEQDPAFDKVIGLDHLSNKNNHYRTVTAIHQVVNYCQKLGVKLYFAGILVDSYFLPYLTNLPNYTQLFGHYAGDHELKFLDIGTDNLHPGPLTHQYYASTLLDKIANA